MYDAPSHKSPLSLLFPFLSLITRHAMDSANLDHSLAMAYNQQ